MPWQEDLRNHRSLVTSHSITVTAPSNISHTVHCSHGSPICNKRCTRSLPRLP